MEWNITAFADNLVYMGEGMLCIFVVIGVLIGITALLEGVLNLLVAVYAVKIQKQGKVDVIETHAEIKGEDDL